MREVIATDKGPKAIGPYSQGIRANGFVFLSGQIPLDPTTQQIVEGDIQVQTERVLKNIQGILEASGTSLDKVVKTTVFLKNMCGVRRHERGLRQVLHQQPAGTLDGRGRATS